MERGYLCRLYARGIRGIPVVWQILALFESGSLFSTVLAGRLAYIRRLHSADSTPFNQFSNGIRPIWICI